MGSSRREVLRCAQQKRTHISGKNLKSITFAFNIHSNYINDFKDIFKVGLH